MPAVLSKPLAGQVFAMFPPEIERIIILGMDFPALMKFRALCRLSFAIVDHLLRSEFRSIIAHKVPRPRDFEDALSRFDAYLSTYTALAFFVRDDFHKRVPMEVFVSRQSFDALRVHMKEVQGAALVVDRPLSTTPGVLRWSVWRTPQGRISLYKSSSNHALIPIVHASSTAMMVYVNPTRFGVLWPRLTFNWRAMPGPLFDAPTYANTLLRDVGFSIRLYVWMWKDGGRPQRCAADRYLCPAQPRYFQDEGSFQGSWSPVDTAPLVLPVCFRLDTRPCRGACRGPHIHISKSILMVEY